MTLLAVLSLAHFQIAIAVVGFAGGTVLGHHVAKYDKHTPPAIGLITAALCYFLAEALMYVALAIVCGAVLLLAVRGWSTVHAAVLQFMHHAGVAGGRLLRSSGFQRKATSITDEYDRRRSYFHQLPIDAPSRERLTTREQSLYVRAIERLSTLFPYVEDDNPSPHREAGRVDDLYDME
jgi:hypothetical protein